MPKHDFRLVMTPLTQTIYAGRIRQADGYATPAGPRHDVTGDFYNVLIQLGEAHNGSFFITDPAGVPQYSVEIGKVEQEASNDG